MTVSARSLRSHLLIGASLATLSVAGTAHAQNLGAGRTANPAVAAAQASQNAATRNAAAQAAAARTRAAFDQASRVRQQMDAAQAAAREAARAAQSNIPNGLGAGGLQVANGVEVDPSLWVGADGPTQSQGADGRTNVTVEQTQEKAILTWDSFNVGRETDLTFDQQGNASWIALNRVTDASADPTQILGSIKADGSVYIINPNGVIFGGASQVNVRNLIASTLEIHGGNVEWLRPQENNAPVSDERWAELREQARDQKFMDGLFGNNAQDYNGAFGGQMTFWDGVAGGLTNEEQLAEMATAASSRAPGVTVSAGARIKTADSGSVILTGRNVDNSGVISSPSGQVLLAAGRGLTLVSGTGRMMGFYTTPGYSRDEADLFKIAGYIGVVQQGGRVSNDGLLESTLGNVSLVGAAVLHHGLISATTGVDRAGSVIIDASSKVGLSAGNPRINGDAVGSGDWRGAVTIGKGSHISILADASGRTAPGATFIQSDVEIIGNQIVFEQDSVLWAPGATLYLTADTLDTGWTANQTPGRIYLDRGATIDVSGLNGVEIDMEQNSIRAELRANEFADNPVMRDSDLRGETVYFDGRLGEGLSADGDGVANLSGWYDLIQRDVEQFMTVGGSITMGGAEIITREGSTIDLSGGSVQYNDGFVRRTRLIDAFGRLVPIEEAVAGVKYVGIEGDAIVNHVRWGVTERFENPFGRVSEGSWQQGYTEGRSAGSLTLMAGSARGDASLDGIRFKGDLARIFEGEVKAGVVVGENQRDAPTGAGVTDVSRIWRERPSLAALTIGEAYVDFNNAFLIGGDIVIADEAPQLGDDFTAESALFDRDATLASLVEGITVGRHVLSADWFDGETFGNVTIHSGDSATNLYTGAWSPKPDAPTASPGGVLTIEEGVTVDLGDYGSFNFIGRQANIDGTIRARGGSVSLEGTFLPNGAAAAQFDAIPDALRPGITLGATGVIDVSGRWTNNYLEALAGDPLSNAVVDGGDVSLQGYRIALAEGSVVDVSGGAHLATDGKTLTVGDGGSITLDLDTSLSIGPQTGGELVVDGALYGHAPGKGGALNIHTPWELIVAEDWGDLESVVDGVLETGAPAPKDLVLAEALTLPAGAVLDFDLNLTVQQLTGGEPLVSSATLTGVTNTAPVTVLVDWVVPAGVTARSATTSTNQVYTAGMTVPAGTRLRSFGTGASNGSLPAGFVMPTGVFQTSDGFSGLRLSAAGAQVLVSAGTPLAADTTLPVGYTLAKGTVLDRDVMVRNDFRLVSPTLFQAGSHAPSSDDWGDLASIADGTMEGGSAAPVPVRLVAPVIVPAGDTLPAGASYEISSLPLDEPLPTTVSITGAGGVSYANPIAVGAEWVVPTGVTLYTSILVNGVWQSSGQALRAGDTVPAGTHIGYMNGTLQSGVVVPAGVFPQGLRLPTPVVVQAAKGDVLTQNATIAAGTALEPGTVLTNDARVAFAGRLSQGRDFHDGFASFALTGAQGLTIKSDTVIAPTHDTLQLTGAMRDIATGARLMDLAATQGSPVSLVHSTDLPDWQQRGADLMLGSRPVSFGEDSRGSGWAASRTAYTEPSQVVLESGAEIRMGAQSRVMLNGTSNLFVDGVIEAKGGEIVLQRSSPASGAPPIDVVVGDNARLLAGGYQAVIDYVDGHAVRRVEAGGNIEIGNNEFTSGGSVRVLVGEGALLDVSGVSGPTDLPSGAGGDGRGRGESPLMATPTHGAGGSISISASHGLVAGELRLAPGGETGLGGRLAFNGPPSGIFEVRERITDLDPTTITSSPPIGSLVLSAERISASGADDLVIGGRTPNAVEVRFQGDVGLSARRSVIIETRRFSAVQADAEEGAADTNVTIESAYVRLNGSSASGAPGSRNVIDQSNSLTVRAGLIDLIGGMEIGSGSGFDGFATTDLVATGDIRLIGHRENVAGVVSGGAIRFDSAQVYAAPGWDWISGVPEFVQYDPAANMPGFLVSSPVSIEVRGNGGAAPLPLAWGGKLTLRAPEIIQAGVLRAPLGTIALEAADGVDAEGNAIAGRLTLAPGSLTTVSLEGSMALAGLMTSREQFLGYAREDWTPSKAILMSGDHIDLQNGAVVDLSGGGDLVGYSFSTGASGVTNILNEGTEGAAFAILPSYSGPTPVPVGATPLGGQAGWQNSNPERNGSRLPTGTSDARLRVGDQVFLTGLPGLADGYYTLLPAAFALHPGGMLVKPVTGGVTAGPQANRTLDDGSVVASGYRAVAGTAIRPDQGWSSFQIMDGKTWRQYSTITTYSFNEQRAASNAENGLLVRTPHDAGRLVIEATGGLALLGDARLAGGGSGDKAGLAGDVDISNPGGGIALIAAGLAAPEGWLAVDAKAIEHFAGAGSLLVGGRRPITTRVPGDYNNTPPEGAPGVTLTTTANDVLIGDGVTYQGLELLLAASDTITIGEGARLTAAGASRADTSDLLLSQDGALLRLSSAGRADLVRAGGAGASGLIAIGSGAVLRTDGALSLDASAGFDLPADAVLDVGMLDLASDSLNIGDTPEEVVGTVLALDTLERLAGASDLLLRGHQSMVLWGDFTLGARGADGKATLGSLTFDAPVIEGRAGTGEGMTLTAGTLTLRNSGDAAQSTSGTGTLTLDLDRLVLADGAIGISGYDSVGGSIAEIRAQGIGALTIAGDADLTVGRVTAATGAAHGLNASGVLALRQGQAVSSAADGLGGSFSFTGASVLFDTAAVAKAGSVSIEATGGRVELGAHAVIDVSGSARDFIDTVRYAPGGVVTLTATGDVATHDASLIDVSGDKRGGAAGVIEVTAGGGASLAGQMKAETAEGYAGGEFALDARETDFSDLNARLNAGRFTVGRDIRLDEAIMLAAGERIEAHQVTLRSDGDVRIAGVIAANGDTVQADGGVVKLIGANVLLEGTGLIEAAAGSVAASDFQPASGTVVLAADEGRVEMASGSRISLTGGRQGGGRLTVRAARTAHGSEADLSGTVTGAREKILVGSRVYEADTVDALLMTAVRNDANAWLVAGSPTPGWERGAGIVIRSSGDLTVSEDIDLSTVSGPGYLALEAGGDLLVDANISDGFAGPATTAALDAGASFSLGLQAGGDIRVGEMAPGFIYPVVAGGQAFDRARPVSEAVPFTVAAAWVVPAGISLYDAGGGYYAPNSTVPAGTTITSVNGNRSFAAGYVLPADAFPNGLAFAPEKVPFTGEGRVVRTGSGDIDVRAGRDLLIGAESALYTAGRATATQAGFDRGASVQGEFPTAGGDIRLTAGRDITVSPIEQTPTAWLFRYGDSTWNGDPNESRVVQQTAWSVVPRNYQFGVGTLGGGDITVRAKGDITDFAAALPTTGHLTTPVGERATADALVVRGGGDLRLRAFGDIAGGSYVLGRGQAELIAGGSVTGGSTGRVVVGGEEFVSAGRAVFQTRGLAPLFGLMDATVSVQAAGGAEIEGAYDLGLVPQIQENHAGAGSAWIALSERSALDVVAAGDILYRGNNTAVATLTRDNRNAGFRVALSLPRTSTPFITLLANTPGAMRLTAMDGDFRLEKRLHLSSAPEGTLEILARGGISIFSSANQPPQLALDATGQDYLRNALLPVSTDGHAGARFPALTTDSSASIANNYYRGYTLLHARDSEPVRIYALEGDIALYDGSIYDEWRLLSPKAVRIQAGGDIGIANLSITHNRATDLSTVIAGRDLYGRGYRNGGGYRVYGEGDLWIEAGRHYLQQQSAVGTIVSAGNGSVVAVARVGDSLLTNVGGDRYAINYALPDRGADIHLVTGMAQGADYQAFADLYLDPANLADPAFGLSHPSNQGKVVHTYEEELEAFLKGRGFSEVTDENRRELFDSLPQQMRQIFLQKVLAEELRQTGIDYNNAEGPRFQQYTRGYSALHLLYPETDGLDRDSPSRGDILLNNGALESVAGGSINLIAPFGRIGVGDPTDPIVRPDAGVVTRRGGDITMLSNGTISLDQSRVFTLQGGNLMMWTSNGDITAGVGAKTNVTSVPLSFRLDKNGLLSVNVFGLQTGAGIGVLDAFEGRDPDRKPSRMDLLAFFGEVNAGDAGIRVVGDINIAALRVVNAANIEVSGEAVGIPQVPAVNMGALNAASAATSAVINEAAQLAERNRPQVRTEMPTILNVRFLGFGE